MKAKKHLGQHFLTSKKALSDIIRAGELNKDDCVLEIGPGKGVLTEALLHDTKKVVAVEMDTDLIPLLAEKFKKEIEKNKFNLINADILELDLKNLKLGTYKLIANIPYYITGAIIRKFLSEKNKPGKIVLLIQKEVAERICSKNGKESLLSLSVKVYGSPKIVSRVPKGAFSPAPNVDSAIISISTNIKSVFKSKASEEGFFKVLHAGFAHPRKMLLGNLSKVYKGDLKVVFESLNMSLKIRSEDVPLEKWLEISQALNKDI
jgi:16S rRNA (adenine1518-N6/adenine1519-N6)-dimethyltransferase